MQRRAAKLSDEQIVANYRRGDHSRTRLARLAAVSRTRIDRILAEAGIDLVPSYLDETVQAGIVTSYLAGDSIPDVARTYRVAAGTATLVILKAGALRSVGRPAGRLRLHPGIDVLDLHASGGARAVADMAGVSTATAYRLLREAKSTHRGPTILAAEAPCEAHGGHECVECGA